MIKRFQIPVFVVLLALCNVNASAQLHDVGGIGSISLAKDFGWTEIGVEQEFRFDQALTSFNRSATSLSAEFTLIRKMLKAEVDYNFLYRRKDENYEPRHRTSASVTLQRAYSRFSFKLRTRGQATFRDESRGDYKFNPRYVWRNKLECSYTIYGTPFRPYAAVEVFCPLNGEYGFFMDSYRLSLGTRYRISSMQSLNFQLRFDQDIQQADPKNVLYFGVAWNHSL